MDKKIAFLGTPNFAVPILKSIHQSNYKISCVFSQPPRKSNRGHKLNKSPIHLLSEELGIEIKTPENIEKEIDYIKSLNLDLAIVVAYGQILSKDILSLSKNGFINIHASLLPKWRGAAPIQRSLINMDKITGLSIMKINPKLDEGPVCNTYPLDILENENAKDLADRLSNLAAENQPSNLVGDWTNPEDKLELESDGKAKESTGTFETWYTMDGKLYFEDQIYYYEYEYTIVDDILFMAPYDDDVLLEDDCVAYLKGLTGESESYYNDRINQADANGDIPNWCN